MDAKHETPNIDLAELFKKYEKDYGPIKEFTENEISWGKPKGNEVW